MNTTGVTEFRGATICQKAYCDMENLYCEFEIHLVSLFLSIIASSSVF